MTSSSGYWACVLTVCVLPSGVHSLPLSRDSNSQKAREGTRKHPGTPYGLCAMAEVWKDRLLGLS